MSDLDDIFDSVSTEGGDTEDFNIPQNADVFMGDDLAEGEDATDFDLDLDDGADESVSDETDTDEDDETEDISDEDDATDDEFDFESVKDKPVSVTVNGETFEVPLAELRNGYMRQADYTRKTQQLAADGEVVRWAQVLRQELTTNPQAVVLELAERFGVQLTPQNDPWSELVENDPSLVPLVDQVRRQEQELAELRRSAQTTAQDRESAAVQAELNDVKARFADFDPQVVIPIALQNGVRLEQAYKIWKADQITSAEATKAESQRKAEEAAARRDKARKAKSKVSQGASKSKATETDAWQKFDSFEDILNHELNR